MIAGEELMLICPTCSGHFKPHNRLQKYCDSSCRNKANYKKHKRISRGELIEWIKENQGTGDCEHAGIDTVAVYALLEFLGEM